MFSTVNRSEGTTSLGSYISRFSIIVFFFLIFFSAVPSRAQTSLAAVAGLSKQQIQHIIHKVIHIETTTGSYTAYNKKSGAYGRYQIMPKTARAYAKKLHIPYSQWKRPKNQDRIFHAILKDNIISLKRSGIKISAFSIYGSHQQGAGGFHAIMKKKKLTKRLERNLRHNLPKALSSIPRSRLREVWIRYWKKKFS